MDDMASKIQSILSDKDSLEKISELAAMLGLSDAGGAPSADDDGAGAHDKHDNADSDIGNEAAAIMSMVSKLKSFETDDDNIRFLKALKPLLGNEKQERVDKAVRLLRLLNLLPLIKDSGLIGGDLLGVI